MTRHRLIRSALPVGAVAALCAVAAACGSGGAAIAVDPPARTAKVKRGDIHPRFLLTGELSARNAAKLDAPPDLGGRGSSITWIAEDGSAVKAGDPVVELDRSAFAANLEEKHKDLAQATLGLVAQKAQAAVAVMDKQIAVDRATITLKKAEIDAEVPKSLRSLREWQEFQLALKRARTELARAKSELLAQQRAAKLEVKVSQIARDKLARDLHTSETALLALSLKAPRNGIVIISDQPWQGRPFRIGDRVWPGLTVASLPDLSQMKVEAYLSDTDSGAIAVGDAVTCHLDAYPDLPIAGTVESISPVAQKRRQQSQRRAFVVDIAIDKVDAKRMLPGLSVKVEAARAPIKDVLVAPRAGLLLGGDGPVALLADGALAKVELGTCDAHFCEIKNGLSEGDVVRLRGGP